MKKIIFILLLLVSCKNSVNHETLAKIELNKNFEDYPTMDESDISINYKILSFEGETTKQIIPKIDKFIKFDGKIYILSKVMGKGGLYIFNEDGTFVKKLSSGRGQGEFFFASDFIVDETERKIEVLDRFCAIFSYSLNGDFISKKTFPRMDVFEFTKLSDNQYLLFTPNHLSKLDNDTYIKRINDGKIEQEYIDKPKNLRNILMGSHFYKNSDNIFCQGAYGDTLYNFNIMEMRLEPYVQISPVENIDSKLIKNDAESSSVDNILSFNSFRTFSDNDFYSFSVFKDKTYNIFYDNQKKKAYKHLLEGVPYIGYSLVGIDKEGEYFAVSPEFIDKIKSKLTSTKKGTIIFDALLKTVDNDNFKSNPYVLFLSYK